MIKTEQKLSSEITKIFNPSQRWTEQVFVKLFEFLLKNESFYRSYLEAGEQAFMEVNDFTSFIKIINRSGDSCNFKEEEKIYHMVFFAGGIKALAKSWIKRNCKESPEQMAKILTNEYKVNSKYFDEKA